MLVDGRPQARFLASGPLLRRQSRFLAPLPLREIPGPGGKHQKRSFPVLGALLGGNPAAQKFSPRSCATFLHFTFWWPGPPRAGNREIVHFVHFGQGQPLALLKSNSGQKKNRKTQFPGARGTLGGGGGGIRPPKKFSPGIPPLFDIFHFGRPDPHGRDIAKYWVFSPFWPRVQMVFYHKERNAPPSARSQYAVLIRVRVGSCPGCGGDSPVVDARPVCVCVQRVRLPPMPPSPSGDTKAATLSISTPGSPKTVTFDGSTKEGKSSAPPVPPANPAPPTGERQGRASGRGRGRVRGRVGVTELKYVIL